MKRYGNKFGAQKQEFDGLKFDSKKELARYKFLKLKEEAGELMDLVVHPRYRLQLPSGREIMIKGERRNQCASYTPDFQYVRDGEVVIEDVKSKPTAKEYAFKLKRGIFEACYNVDLLLVFDVEAW